MCSQLVVVRPKPTLVTVTMPRVPPLEIVLVVGILLRKLAGLEFLRNVSLVLLCVAVV